MNVAVTGGSGLLGSHLLPALVARGFTVRALARSRPDRALPQIDGVTWIEGALDDAASLRALVEGADAIVHAAYDPVEEMGAFVRSNVVGTLTLLELASSTSQRQLIWTSSLAVYGDDPNADPRGERFARDEDFPLWPTEFYGAHKAALEKMIVPAARAFSVNACALRLGCVLGMREPWERCAFATQVDEALAHGEIRTSKGAYVLAVEDAAALIANGVGDASLAGQVLNVFDRWLDFGDLAETLGTVLGNDVRSTAAPAREPVGPIRNDRISARGFVFQTDQHLAASLASAVAARG